MEIFEPPSVIRLSPIHSLNSFDTSNKSDEKSSHGVLTPAMKKSYPEDFNESSSASCESRSGLQPLQGLLRCLECPQTFKDNPSLRHHFIEAHATSFGKSPHGSVTFPCTHCSQLFPCPTTLKVHQTEHVLPNVQQILNSSCKNTSTNRLLNITFACHSCTSSFPSRDLLIDHANVHLLGHKCDNPTCQNVYSQKEDNTSSRPCATKPLTIRDPLSTTSDKNSSQATNPPTIFSFTGDKLSFGKIKSTNSSPNKSNLSLKFEEERVSSQHLLKDHHQSKKPKGPFKPNPSITNSTNPSTKSSNPPATPTEPRIVNCNGKKRFQCKVCHKYLSSKLSHEEHSRVHTGEKPYRCSICVKSYAVKNTYRQHMASHKLPGSPTTTNSLNSPNGCPENNNLQSKSKPPFTLSPISPNSGYKCSSCLTTFTSQDKLDYHTCLKKTQRTSNKRQFGGGPNNKEGFRCKICGKTFARKEWRKKHYLSHAGESCFRCDICGSIFVDEQIYLIHAQDHFCPSEIKKSFTDCNICGKVFPGRDLYERHSCRFAGVNSSG